MTGVDGVDGMDGMDGVDGMTGDGLTWLYFSLFSPVIRLCWQAGPGLSC